MGLFGKQEKGTEDARPAKPKKQAAGGGGGGRGLGATLMSPYRALERFIRDVVLEMKRVVWPSKDETYTYTVVTVIAVVIVAAWVGAWDMIMTQLVRMLHLYH